MQSGILHVAQDARGVVKFSVVEIGQRRDGLGIVNRPTCIERLIRAQFEFSLESVDFADQHFNVECRIQQLVAGLSLIHI